MRKYTILDMVRMVQFSKENEGMKPVEMMAKYNSEFPEKGPKEQWENLNKALKMFECDYCADSGWDSCPECQP